MSGDKNLLDKEWKIEKVRPYDDQRKKRVIVIAAPYRQEITAMQYQGVLAELEKAGLEHDRIDVTGALEIPAVVAHLEASSVDYYDAYICLGCIIKGETIHDEVIAYTAFKALDELAREKLLAIGNGILTVNSLEQAEDRANPEKQNRGGEAAKAALRMLEIKRQHGN